MIQHLGAQGTSPCGIPDVRQDIVEVIEAVSTLQPCLPVLLACPASLSGTLVLAPDESPYLNQSVQLLITADS